MQITTNNEHETIALGKKFSRTLKGGEVVLLIGGLGAGKTTFVKGVAQGFGIKKNITSPTFVLMKVYSTVIPSDSRAKRGRSRGISFQNPRSLNRVYPELAEELGMTIKRLVHIDTYRGLNVSDLQNIGALEYFGRKDTVCFVEWGANLEKYLKQHSIAQIKVKIKIIAEDKRRFNIFKLA